MEVEELTAWQTTRPRQTASRSISAAAASVGMNVLKPVMHFQISMLRMWADSIERFAGSYDKGVEEAATTVQENAEKDRAA
ncbi:MULTISPECIES: hypothetical protein [unclassified Bradyrhizobium]|uniref:hypothetical protein n=1 Tax=unclassified Bradyrhizobium TaxID=2631580 RepID=UPI002915CB6B|nr:MULTISPECIES: hypothetical protein [unclassified Bradyrhizobium]